MKQLPRLSILCSSIALLVAGCGNPPVLSLHALDAGQNAVFDPALEGEWFLKDGEGEHLVLAPKPQVRTASAAGPELRFPSPQPAATNNGDIWRFDRDGTNRSYALIITGAITNAFTGARTNSIVFDAWLVKLGDSRFLDVRTASFDVMPADSFLDVLPENGRGLYAVSVIRGHCFFKVFQIKPRLEMAWLNADWLWEVLERHPHAIRHEIIGSGEEDKQIVLTATSKELQRFVRRYANVREAWQMVAPKTNAQAASPACTETPAVRKSMGVPWSARAAHDPMAGRSASGARLWRMNAVSGLRQDAEPQVSSE